MDTQTIATQLASLPNGGSMNVSCSSGRSLVTFQAVTSKNPFRVVRSTESSADVDAAIEAAFESLQIKLSQ